MSPEIYNFIIICVCFHFHDIRKNDKPDRDMSWDAKQPSNQSPPG